ncbi:MAG: hypothetical protein F4Z31_06125 [Gemmatimonadetes bacterium]|nr:hypothetical protein [Gemmatimonadota bacterium]MYE95680.1 hypothetical protein [Gemmatimonadota bacterium]MYJ09091.1 hypothetical protein [Gemmatimonadota bacterium]
MSKTKLFFVAAGIAIGLGAVLAPAPASAQPPLGDCAACVSCDQCSPSHWGGESCDYKGKICRCRETGGNCNPGLALNVEPGDRRTIEPEGKTLPLVRLAGNVFGAWSCNGELDAAYREEPNGVLVQVAAAEFDLYKDLFGFERYVGLLGDRVLQQRATQG